MCEMTRIVKKRNVSVIGDDWLHKFRTVWRREIQKLNYWAAALPVRFRGQ
jgi:hypothetical protein